MSLQTDAGMLVKGVGGTEGHVRGRTGWGLKRRADQCQERGSTGHSSISYHPSWPQYPDPGPCRFVPTVRLVQVRLDMVGCYRLTSRPPKAKTPLWDTVGTTMAQLQCSMMNRIGVPII